MDPSPLLDAPQPILPHVLMAIAAVVIAAWQMARPKGTATHVWIGRAWVALMVGVGVSSFWIVGARTWGRFSWIHIVAAATLLFLAQGVLEARRGDVRAHAATMTGLVVGALLITGALTFLPGRTMHRVLFGDAPPQAASKSSVSRSEVGRAWQASVNPASTSQGSSE